MKIRRTGAVLYNETRRGAGSRLSTASDVSIDHGGPLTPPKIEGPAMTINVTLGSRTQPCGLADLLGLQILIAPEYRVSAVGGKY